MSNLIVLLSGGMDSVTALYEVAREHTVVGALGFSYGSKHNHKELPFAELHSRALGIRYEVIDVGFVNRLFASDLLLAGGEVPDGHYEEPSMKQTVVPFRNGIMLAVACGVAESWGADGVVIGAHAGDHAIYPDCREGFMAAFGAAMAAGTYVGVTLQRPFINMSKGEIVSRGVALGVDYAMTWSCYKGGAFHCGTCGTCVERREAFATAGVVDPTVYVAV